MPITKATASSIAPAAKGDLVVGSATNDASVLAVGSANQVLTVDSSTSTGLKWATPSAPSFVGCLLYREASISVTANTAFAIPFNNEPTDTDGFHDNSVNNTRITIPAGKGGQYLFIASMGVGAVNSDDSTIIVRVNGADPGNNNGGGENTGSLDRDRGSTATGNETRGSVVLTLVAGDYVELFGKIDSTASAYIIANFQAIYLGA